MAAKAKPTPTETLIRMCAWCNRTFVNGKWISAKKQTLCTMITHGICSECKANLKRQV